MDLFSIQFPAVFSHAVRKNISVADCCRGGEWIIPLNHITSDRAEREKEALVAFLNSVFLNNSNEDKRGWGLDKHVAADTVWQCAAPKKGKMFAWLMSKGRIKVRSVLFKQNIVDDELCPFGCKARETVEHFALECGRTMQILALVEINLNGAVVLGDIYAEARKNCLANKSKAWDLAVTATYWTIWLSRNHKVFDDVEVLVHTVARQCMETCKLWAHREKNEEKEAVLRWITEWQG
ncbi:hypothetical protein ACQ4PT_057258 [Festuca glaucescens]